MRAVRPATFLEMAGSAGLSARTRRIDTVMVVLKNVRSHPRQKPPGSKAITVPDASHK
jgi:hypothetical protein